MGKALMALAAIRLICHLGRRFPGDGPQEDMVPLSMTRRSRYQGPSRVRRPLDVSTGMSVVAGLDPQTSIKQTTQTPSPLVDLTTVVCSSTSPPPPCAFLAVPVLVGPFSLRRS